MKSGGIDRRVADSHRLACRLRVDRRPVDERSGRLPERAAEVEADRPRCRVSDEDEQERERDRHDEQQERIAKLPKRADECRTSARARDSRPHPSRRLRGRSLREAPRGARRRMVAARRRCRSSCSCSRSPPTPATTGSRSTSITSSIGRPRPSSTAARRTTRPNADLSDRANFLWPMAAVLPIVPLTALPPSVADWLATAVVLATLVAALWVLAIRDWRIYGVVLLWPSVIEARPDGERVAAADTARRADVALPRPVAARRPRARLRRRAEALPLAARGVARARRAARARPRSPRSWPCASLLLLLPVHEPHRLRAPAAEPRGDVRARRVHAVRAAERPRRPRHGGARGDDRPRPRAARRSRGADAASASRSPPPSSCRRSSGVTSSPFSSSRSRSRVHGSTSSG